MAEIGGLGQIGPLGSNEPGRIQQTYSMSTLGPIQPLTGKPTLEKAFGVSKAAVLSASLNQGIALRECLKHIGT